MKIRIITRETIDNWAQFLTPLSAGKGAFAWVCLGLLDNLHLITLDGIRGRVIDTDLCIVGFTSADGASQAELIAASEQDATYLEALLVDIHKTKPAYPESFGHAAGEQTEEACNHSPAPHPKP